MFGVNDFSKKNYSAMAYLDNIIISTATLCEPLLASMIAYTFNVGLLPGPRGWIGNLLVVAGTLAVVYPSMGKGGGGMH
jgi:drug/metabolite transporter (DMT)-like permease